MSWLRAAWQPVAAVGLAALAILAVMSAARQKAIAARWRDKAVSIENKNVVKGISTAEQANTQAVLHDNKAQERTATAEKRITQIAEKNETIASILNGWKK